MRVIGLTGGIAMGKSTITKLLRLRKIPVFDADAAVHRLQAPRGRAVAPIAAAFPGTVTQGRVHRARLREAVLGQPAALRRLERILHPLVRDEERRFIARARRTGAALVVLDIPLLFETGGASRCDHIIAVSAPAAVQRARVRRRRTLSDAQLAAILARQLPDAERRHLADVVIRTGLSRHHAYVALTRALDQPSPGRRRAGRVRSNTATASSRADHRN